MIKLENITFKYDKIIIDGINLNIQNTKVKSNIYNWS